MQVGEGRAAHAACIFMLCACVPAPASCPATMVCARCRLSGCHPPTPLAQILTYLKVEPMQWSAARLRRVLNAAIASPISAQAGCRPTAVPMLLLKPQQYRSGCQLKLCCSAGRSKPPGWARLCSIPSRPRLILLLLLLPQDLAEAEAALQQGFTGSLSRVPTSSSQREAAMSDEAGSGTQEPAAAAASGQAEGAEGVADFLLQQGGSGPPATQPAAAAAAGDDAVAAELAAAAAQQEAELMDMVSGCAYRALLVRSRRCRTNEQEVGAASPRAMQLLVHSSTDM